MRFRLRFFALILVLALAPMLALAQSTPNWPQGYIPSAPEWNLWFSKKQDYSGAATCTFSPCATGIATTANALLGTNAAGMPSFVATLPSMLNIPSPQFSGAAASGVLSGTFAFSTSGQGSISNTTASTSATTGALVVTGGLGIGGAIWSAGGIVVGSPTGGNEGAGTINAAGVYVNGVAVGTGSGNVTGPASSTAHNLATYSDTTGKAIEDSTATLIGSAAPMSLTNTTASTSPTTGALVISGGLGVGGAIYAGGGFINSPALSLGASYQSSASAAYHNLTASGTMSTTNTQTLLSGHIWPFLYDACSDTATESGGSQSTPIGADCRTINFAGLGTGTGDRNGLDINMAISGTAAQTEGDAYFNGAIVTTSASSNLGGTSGTPVGDLYGISTQTWLNTGATWLASVHGAGEWDLKVATGASVTNKIGGEIALVSGDAVQGSNIDAGLLFTDGGSTSWKYGIEFGRPSGQGGSFPIQNGTIIGAYSGQTGNTAANGVDFSGVTFTTCAFADVGFCVNNNHITSSQGDSPTVACTGFGTGASCNVTSGGISTDMSGEVVISVGTSPSTSGTVTLTFGQSWPHASRCLWQLQYGASAWPAGEMLQVSSNVTASNQVTWSGTTAPTASSSVALTYFCTGT